MSPDDLRGFRRRCGLGADLRYFERVGSTNTLAMEAGLAGTPEGLVVLADEQIAGRGRLSRRWSAPRGTSLLLSLLFRPPTPFAVNAPRTSMACALGLLSALSRVTSLPVKLKWPNDAIIERPDGTWGKLAGILSEVGLTGDEPAFLVVGMGINANIAPEELAGIGPMATSLLAELGTPVSRPVLLEALLGEIDGQVAALRAGVDVASAWRAQLAWIGEPIQVCGPVETIVGVAEDVLPDGALCLRLETGERRCFTVGDVSLRPQGAQGWLEGRLPR